MRKHRKKCLQQSEGIEGRAACEWSKGGSNRSLLGRLMPTALQQGWRDFFAFRSGKASGVTERNEGCQAEQNQWCLNKPCEAWQKKYRERNPTCVGC